MWDRRGTPNFHTKRGCQQLLVTRHVGPLLGFHATLLLRYRSCAMLDSIGLATQRLEKAQLPNGERDSTCNQHHQVLRLGKEEGFDCLMNHAN